MRYTYALLSFFLLLIGCKSNTIVNIDDKISPVYLNADFNETTSCIEHRVPNPYYLCTKASYDSAKQKIRSSLNKPMSVIEFHQKISPLFALLKDDHFHFIIDKSLINKLQQENPNLYFPFTVFIDGSRIFINKNLSENKSVKRGDEILSINNISSTTILNKLRYGLLLKPNEENYFERKYEVLFYRSLLLDMGFRNNFTVKLTNNTVKTKGVSAKAITALNDTTNDFTYKILNEKLKLGTCV